MEWGAATAEATQAFGLVIEVTQGHEHGVRKHEQGVRKHVRFNLTMYRNTIIQSILIRV